MATAVIVTSAVAAAAVEAVIAKMPAVPASLHTATLPEHVANPTPNRIGTGLPEAILPLLPSVVPAPLLVLPSPEVRVKLLFDGDPKAIEIFPPAALSKSPVIMREMSAVLALSLMATLFEYVAHPNGIGIEGSEAMLQSLPSVITAPLLVSPSPKDRVKLLVDGDPETIDTSPPVPPDKSPAISLNASPMLVSAIPALFHLAMLFEHVADPMPDGIGMGLPKASLPLLLSIVMSPLLMLPSPKGRVRLLVGDGLEGIDISPPAASGKSPAVLPNSFPVLVPEMPAVPALFHTATLVEHVAGLMPNGIWMELPEDMLLSLPSVVTAPLLVLPSPEGRVKLLVDGGPETVDASPPAASNKSPAVLLIACPMLVLEMPAVPASFHVAMLF